MLVFPLTYWTGPRHLNEAMLIIQAMQLTGRAGKRLLATSVRSVFGN